MVLPAIAMGLLRTVGTRALAMGGEQLAKTGAFQATAPKLSQTNLGAKDLFKQAFTSSGMASPAAVLRQQNDRAASDQDSRSKAEATEALKKFGQATAVAGTAIAGVPTIITQFGKSLLASQEHLRAYSVQLQHAYSVLEGNRLKRTATHARNTEASTTALAEAIDSLEATLAPHMAVLANGINYAATAGAFSLEAAVAALETISPGLGALVELMRKKGEGDPLPIYQVMEGIAKRGREVGKSRFSADEPKEEKK